MTVKDLVESYKGDLEIVVKQLTADDAIELVSFNVVEKDAIKDDIMDADVSKFYVEVENKIPAIAKIVVLLKATP